MTRSESDTVIVYWREPWSELLLRNKSRPHSRGTGVRNGMPWMLKRSLMIIVHILILILIKLKCDETD